MDMLIFRVILYVVTPIGVLLYIYMQRRRSNAKIHQAFKENLDELGMLVNELPTLTDDDIFTMTQLFWNCYCLFDSVMLEEYLKQCGVVVPENASSWEERSFALKQLGSMDKISTQHLDALLDMRKFIFYLETATWPGVPYDEREFLETCAKKIPFYYETIKELVSLMEESHKS